jgi:hypothetical protein
LGLEHLDDLLMECKTLFLNKMSPDQKAKIKKEVDKEFQKITASINEYIHN